MAARLTSGLYRFALILIILQLVNCNYGAEYGNRARRLHINPDKSNSGLGRTYVVNNNELFDDGDGDYRDEETSFARKRREAVAEFPDNNPNITTKVNVLNDTHQQLMVHWVGEKSNVIICLARDSTPVMKFSQMRFSRKFNPSTVYISYDYGDTFENKNEHFKITDGPNPEYARLDKFYNHPKFNTYCVFADSSNNVIFVTSDNGKNITRQKLEFTPSEISFNEDNPNHFLAFDKVDPKRRLWMTTDLGKTWEFIHMYVKAYFWSNTQPKTLLIERIESPESNTVVESNRTMPGQRAAQVKVVFENAHDFQVRGDWMFATVQEKVTNPEKQTNDTKTNLDLYVSYKNSRFVKADFNTDLDRYDYHIADVSNNRVFVAVAHSATQVNLYVLEGISPTDVKFALSLESILTFFPNTTWKDSWLNDVADEAFTDLYKVQGMRGIYIASQVKQTPKAGSIGPEHLGSLITYDHGVTWNKIKGPSVKHDGFWVQCGNDCSLHLCQKFSQLYPVTRSVSIMSSDSAPGIIMATGVMGQNFKSHPALFVSRDAGLTWKMVLKDFYFFNMGDHGGVLVAVKYFKTRGETYEFLYSTDEGKSWKTYRFHDEMLRVYGLMTEPGENTTVFTMFGSMPGQHRWLIIKVDLRKVFERDCRPDDFKFWSPTSTEQPVMACVLGRKETYERRAATTNCYTGINYDRPIKHEFCQCDLSDYHCDVGFVRTGTPYHCIQDKNLVGYDPYAVPDTCKPGQFYNRTKGYRKVPDDECIGGAARRYEPDQIPCPMDGFAEFLLVAQREHISRIDLTNQTLERLPVRDLKNVIAIEFDMRNKCLYWADIVNDTIGRQCLSDGRSYPEILVETDLSSIEGMALDWISNVLYFVDGVKMRIQIIRTDLKIAGRMRRTILGPDNLQKPRGIAVHPMAGYMFWTDWAPGNASVSRANLDGSNVKRLFTKGTVEWPNGITIDHIAERIYWVDAREDYIGSSDFDGKRFKKIIHNDDRVSHPFAVAVYKGNMYWDDWKQLMIYIADKDHGVGRESKLGEHTGLMDLKVFAHSIQTGTNKCTNNSAACTHLCLGAPNDSYVCLCPDGMEMIDDKCMCPGNVAPFENSTCPRVAATCAANQFACGNGVCVPAFWKCDGDNDCGDNSDELSCNRPTCSPNDFECDYDKCIPKYWLCDLDWDCRDGRDEINCTYSNCTESQFKCANGRCISHRWHCDGEDDCRDNSDEVNCTNEHEPGTCRSEEITCLSDKTCIPRTWRCDGEQDCEDHSDEKDCNGTTCALWLFECGPKSQPGSHDRCIYQSWVCDGVADCKDGSDEANCTTTATLLPTTLPPPPPPPPDSLLPTNSCSQWMFSCNNKKCVPYWWKCDDVDDCGDGSDEIGCNKPFVPSESPNTTELPRVCGDNLFQCYDGKCLVDAWVCDGTNDCRMGEDELFCDTNRACREDQFMCRTDGSCVPLTNICNGYDDCPDRSDELGCDNDQQSPPGPAAAAAAAATPSSCYSGFFSCDETLCLALSSYCDGKQDCFDGFDESNCEKNNTRVYQVMIMGMDERSTNATSLFLFWWMPVPSNVTLEFLPSYSLVEPAAKWTNASKWIEDTEYQFNHLEPFTSYNLTVYVRLKGQSNNVFPPSKYLVMKTGEGVPSEPWNVTAVQRNGTRVQVSWRPPLKPNGPITGYEGFVTPPIPPMQYSLQKTSMIVDIPFEAGKNYSFWVIAKNREHASASSKVVTLTFDGSANVDDIRDLRVLETTNNSVKLTWRKLNDVDGYHVTPRAPTSPSPYPFLPTQLTLLNTYEVKGLAPGTQYTFEVNAVKKTYVGKVVFVSATTLGQPLPTVSNLIAVPVKFPGTAVKLSWDPPKSTRKLKWQYAVYYALNMQDLFRAPKLLTPNMTATIKDLEACESYIFAVGVRGPYGAGPLSQPVTVPTYYDIHAPPKRLRVTPSDKPDTIIVSWSASCPMVVEPINYTISVTEMTLNKQSMVTLPATNDTLIKHTFKGIKYGGKYRITISTDVENAIPSQAVIYVAPPILPPHQLTVLPEGDANVLYWQEQGLPDGISRKTEYHYEIIVNEGERTINETSAKKFHWQAPPFIFKQPKAGVIYTYAVRLVTEEGYRSMRSEAVSIQSPLVADWPVTMNTSNIVSLAIPILLLIIALGAGLAYFVVRHRRLSNSFTQFANSHYDTRRGQATFPGTTDGLDEEDSPVIRGFSDDEPLVIA